MKHLLLVIFSVIGSIHISFAQAEMSPDSIIYWSEDQELVWTDFEGLAERYSSHAAFSVVGFQGRLNYTDQEYRVVIRTYFDKYESWSKTWTGLLLMHEQGHFDLAEVQARKFRKRVLEEIQRGRLTSATFTMLNTEAQNELEEAQNRYDQATNFSMNYREQVEWAKLIKRQLEELSDYANPEIIFKRK